MPAASMGSTHHALAFTATTARTVRAASVPSHSSPSHLPLSPARTTPHVMQPTQKETSIHHEPPTTPPSRSMVRAHHALALMPATPFDLLVLALSLRYPCIVSGLSALPLMILY